MPRRTRAQSHLVWGLAVTETVSFGILYYAFAVLLVPMQRDLGWSRATLVAAFTVAVAVSGLAAPAVGRRLDRSGARALVTAASAAGAALVLAWSQVRTPAVLYLVFGGIGIVMAFVLYDAAFTILAQRTAPDHRRAITTVTLVAGCAAFVFQPAVSAIVEGVGWRTTLVVLAGVLGAVTVPIHLVALRAPVLVHSPTAPAGDGATDARFWQLVGAFTLVNGSSAAVAVLLLSTLVDQGWTLGRAALASGLLGLAQLPGRALVGRGAHTRRVAGTVLALPAVGVATLHVAGASPLVWPGVVLLGIGQGGSTLLRATIFVDLYGLRRIGALNGLAARPITAARAFVPLGAAALLPVLGRGPTFLLLAAASAVAAALGIRALTSRAAAAPSPAGSPSLVR